MRGDVEGAGGGGIPFPGLRGLGGEQGDGATSSNLRPWMEFFPVVREVQRKRKEEQEVARSTASRLRPSSDLGVFKESEEGTAVNPFPLTPWLEEVRGDDGVESKFRPAVLRGKIQKKQKKQRD